MALPCHHTTQLSLLCALTFCSGCLSHPAVTQGDRLVELGELARAHAVYQEGLEQGVDSEQERTHIKNQLSKVHASLRQQEIDEAMTQIEQGDLGRALEIFEVGAWGDEVLMARSTQLLEQRLVAHLRQREQMDRALFERVLSYEVMREAGEPVAREVLTQKFDALARATGSPASRAKELAGIVKHPAWHVDGVEAMFRPGLLELGDAFVRGLDAANSEQDFEAALIVHNAQGFGHAPWHRASLEKLSDAVKAGRQRVRELATTQGELVALEELAALHSKLPMNAAQASQNAVLFDTLMAAHAAPLLALAREKKALGQPAQAHVYAALAHYYGANLPADLNLSRHEASVVGHVPETVQVIVELEYDYNGNCQEPARDEGPIVLGPDSATKKERAIVTTYFSCTQTVTYTESTTIEEGFEYDKNETAVSQYDYCRGNSLTDRQFAECNRALDNMSTAERDERLTSSNPEFRKVYNEKVARTRNVDHQSTWHALVSFRGKSYRVGEGATGDGKVGNPQQARFLGVNGLYKQIEQENEAQIARARSATIKKLNAARDTGDFEGQLGAAMRLAWLPSAKTIELDELSREDAKLFALGGERIEVATAALRGDRRQKLSEPAQKLEQVEATGILEFDVVDASLPMPKYEPFEVSDEQVKLPDMTWQSTGLEQHIDYGSPGKQPGSSMAELAVSVARVPLVDAPLAMAAEPKLTLKHTSLGGAIYMNPPGETDSRGFSLGLKRALVRQGAYNDPKITSYLGVSYTQLARGLEPELRRHVSTQEERLQHERFTRLYRQGAGYRFLGAELGASVPLGIWVSADVGSQLNALALIDLFDDGDLGEYQHMSSAYTGMTLYVGPLFLHGRASYWFGRSSLVSPVGGMVKLGVRL